MDRERLRASHAFAFAAQKRGQSEAEKILSRVRELPSMLQTNGLLATWAFYLASGERHGYRPVAEAVLGYLQQAELVGPADRQLTVERIFAERWLSAPGDGGLSGLELRSLTAETILYAVWLKRAGEALLSATESGGPDAGEGGDTPDNAPDDGSTGETVPEENGTP